MSEKSHNLLIRTVTGTVFVAVVLTMMLAARGSYWALLLMIACLCTIEFWNLARTRSQLFWGPLYIVLCMAAMGVFPMIGSGMSDGVQLWSEGAVFAGGWPEGWDVRIAPAFVLIVWSNDVFAYLVGVSIGRHKMAPRISPNKSWEGFAGGIVGATLVAAAIGHFLMGGNVWLWTAFGVVVALTSVAGDLAESLLKRRAGVKDSGRLLPGHGGALDRFDAMLGAIPAAFLFLIVTYLFK